MRQCFGEQYFSIIKTDGQKKQYQLTSTEEGGTITQKSLTQDY
jgi:hypothetical protein